MGLSKFLVVDRIDYWILGLRGEEERLHEGWKKRISRGFWGREEAKKKRRELLGPLCVKEEFGKVYIYMASDKCQKEKRKTINGDDLVWALTTLGFEDYIEPLKAYLIRYREMEGDTKGSARGGDTSARKDIVGGQLGSSTQNNNGADASIFCVVIYVLNHSMVVLIFIRKL
ncbi:hypothetical protein HAX54_009300 [Datura stramonium]|uniref:Transcription factor CBF/NF-Y/archaeal histone domain-containing protein n=1 Tax=Datura stramonium TaxID=4076 RepID=A0ABS8TFJ3_DATST|nr:hypothetical protein [Datura stramonium]